MRYRLEIPGDPVAWKRARRKGNRYFTDPAQARYQAAIRLFAAHANVKPIDGPVGLMVSAQFRCRKSDHRKREPFPGAWQDTKPDLDNLIKVCADALNGIAYRDDAQIVKAYAEKRRAPQNEEPALFIEIYSVAS